MSGTPSTTPPSSRKATFSLVLGLLAVICVPFNLFPAIPGLILGLLGVREIGRSAGMMTGKGLAITGILLNSLGMLCGCGIIGAGPFAYIRVRDKVNEAAGTARSINNLKQIALAVHNYDSTMGKLPEPTGGTTPSLSWRVPLLPYMEQMRRFQQFNQLEPWDGPHNRTLLSPTPEPYVDPLMPVSTDATHYRAFVGPNTLFPDLGNKSLYSIANIPDGTSNTILCVQATDGVPWSKQDELTYQPGQTLSRLGPPGKDFFLVAMCDGSVRIIKKTVSEQTLRNAIDPRDGEPLANDW